MMLTAPVAVYSDGQPPELDAGDEEAVFSVMREAVRNHLDLSAWVKFRRKQRQRMVRGVPLELPRLNTAPARISKLERLSKGIRAPVNMREERRRARHKHLTQTFDGGPWEVSEDRERRLVR